PARPNPVIHSSPPHAAWESPGHVQGPEDLDLQKRRPPHPATPRGTESGPTQSCKTRSRWLQPYETPMLPLHPPSHPPSPAAAETAASPVALESSTPCNREQGVPRTDSFTPVTPARPGVCQDK